MISRRGIELAVSTLVVLVIAILLLIGLAFFLTGGFARLKDTTKPFTDTTESTAIREACRLACTAENYPSFCCTRYSLGDESVLCTDSRLDVECAAAQCEQVFCQ
ncbi:MAG: hypothetical protein AABX53_02150 [Nanoarchaeota archaeon]